MTDLEHAIGDALRRRADVMDIPLPPVERLVAEARTSVRQRRRRLVLVAAVAVVLAAVGPWLVLRGGTRTEPTRPPTPMRSPTSIASPTPSPSPSAHSFDELPEGPPPNVPYLDRGALHVGGAITSTGADVVLAAGATVLVGRVGEQHAQWWLLDKAVLIPVPELDGVFSPHLAPRGDLLAWPTYPDARTTRIVAWDPQRRVVVDHVDLDAPYAACCGGGQEIEIYGIDADDNVYWAQRGGYQVWRPDHGGPLELTGVGAMLEIAPTGPVRQGGALGRVDARGHWSRVGKLPTDQGLVWAADGTLVAYSGDDAGVVAFKEAPTALWVVGPTGDHRVRLHLPSGARGGAVAFESDKHLLVEVFVDPRRHYVLRCDTSDGQCERTPLEGRPTWALPASRGF